MMNKIKITEQMKIHDTWYKEARSQTMESLLGFIQHMLDDYEHDYGTICHALAAGAVGTMWAMNSHDQGGITGFQAGAVMWEVIRHWNHENNKTGMKLIDYDNLLYPQYEEKCDKIISRSTWEAIKKEAQRSIDEESLVHPNVKSHWESIVKGKIPFGYTIDEND